MYLEHYGIKELPFTLTPNINYFCNLSGHQEALNTVLLSLRSGEGFIKVIGEVGAGKTLLCRKLLESLEDDFVTTYIPNPDLNPSGLRRAFAQELGVDAPTHVDQHTLLTAISDKLLAYSQQGKRVVLFIDEAQALSDRSLEALRLLTNLETPSEKLMQIVLFAQPELNERLKQNNLRQLRQRITFSYQLKPIKQEELKDYLCHRLAMAGYTRGSLFSRRAEKILYACSAGIPRLINIVAHKALMVSFGKGKSKVDSKAVMSAIRDSEGLISSSYSKRSYLFYTLVGIVLGVAIVFEYHYAGLLHWS